MTRYNALLVAPDGDWTTDFDRETVEEVQDELCNMGSRWYFYPFHAVIRDNGPWTRPTQRIVDAAWPFEHMKGRTIRTFSQMIVALPEESLEAILSC